MGLFTKKKVEKTKGLVVTGASSGPISPPEVPDQPHQKSPAHFQQLKEARETHAQNRAVTRPQSEHLFLSSIRMSGNTSRACEAAGISRSTAYAWRDNSDSFRDRWEEAHNSWIDDLESEVDRRAFEGMNKPVIYKGELVRDAEGELIQIKEFSDGLARFRLGALRPDKYRERTETHHTGGTVNSMRVTMVMPDNGRN